METGKQPTVKVFGSAVLRVEPDLVSLVFSVGRKGKQPRDALKETHQAARVVRAYLDKSGVNEVAASRIRLSQTSEYTSGKQVPTGYFAQVTFNVLLGDLDRMEEVLAGVVDAGVNEIGSAQFRTTRLKEHRTEARRRAVAAAREKAEVYCKAAGVSVGTAVQIEDVHPDSLRGTEGSTSNEVESEEMKPDRALSPGSIVVSAAVSMTFVIVNQTYSAERP